MVCSSVLPLGATIAHFVYSEVDVDSCESWWAGLSIIVLVSLCNLIFSFYYTWFHKLLLFCALKVLQVFLILINTWFSIVFICFKCWFPRTLVTISKSINQDLWVTAHSQVGIFWTLMSVHRHTYGELYIACIWRSKGDCRRLFVQTQQGSGVSGENVSLKSGVSCLPQPLRNKAFEQI